MPETAQRAQLTIPFDAARLDGLMEEACIDVLLATSKHNVQYLLGGHRAFFFDYMDAMGLSRYLPIVIYPKGAPDKAAFIGHRLENFQREVKPFWTPEVQTSASGSVDAAKKAIAYLRKAGIKARHIGAELAFLPFDAANALRRAFPDSELVDAVFALERLRARKTPAELEKLRTASDRVIDSMLAVIAHHGAGTTKQELADALKREEVNRGLTFEYCLIAAGASHNRAPSEQRWEADDVLSLDSGGNYRGYIGDLAHGGPWRARCRAAGPARRHRADPAGRFQADQGRPHGRLHLRRRGGAARKSKQHNHLHFLAHGMGLVSHEAPRLTASGPVPYDAYDASRPLESGMVVSVETTLQHPRRGFIKLEDTVAVTDSGFEIFGEGGRGWNRGDTAVDSR